MDGLNASRADMAMSMAAAGAAAARVETDASVTPLRPRTGSSATTHVDVLIVGAGLSGIGFAWTLQQRCPQKSYAILEARGALGGTWDLFRYPGIRSDSDMHTLGYSFRPWREEKSIADGPSILKYLQEAAVDYGIDRKIRYGHKAVSAVWSSADGLWTVDVALSDGRTEQWTCNFLQMCAGYYDYDAGYMPGWAGMERFRGTTVHPQAWPEDLDYAGKRVVVIGSGATAVTLVPAMAEKAAHVTMLQRSPTFMVSRPARDPIANWLHGKLPAGPAHALSRWKNILLGMYFYRAARKNPERAKGYLIKMAQDQVGPNVDAKHLTPRYFPWDQRLCLVPDGDMFNAIRDGKADIVTDEIETFTETGIKLKSGEELAADIIVTATGLRLRPAGGLKATVDGRAVDFGKTMNYRGVMFSDVPNLGATFGYTNASWTLKADLTAEYLCRVINHMTRGGFTKAMPHNVDPSVVPDATPPLASGYFQRGNDVMPKQGSRAPWKLYQNYARDLMSLRFGRVDDGVIAFSTATNAAARRKAAG